MIEELFAETPVVPVVVIDNADDAVRLAETLLSAGIKTMEITLRTPGALDAIEAVARAVPDVVLGAGSIRSPGQLGQALDAGARFCVSPGFSAGILTEAKQRRTLLIPGAATASEIMQLVDQDYDFVKFFPAELSGGVAMLKALSAPLPEVRFFPTGGINPDLAADYLALPSVVCVGGSWFVPPDKIREGDFGWIHQQSIELMARLNG